MAEMFDADELAELIGDFLEEAGTLIENLGNRCLEFEEELQTSGLDIVPVEENIDRVNEMFRVAHSLKGASAMLGIANVNSLTHRMENVLEAVRSGTHRFDQPLIEALLQCLDRLEIMLHRLAESRESTLTEEDDAFLAWLEESLRDDLAGGVGDQSDADDAAVPVFDGAALIDVEAPEPELPEIDAAPIETANLSEPHDEGDEVDEHDYGFDMGRYMQLYLDETDEEITALNNGLLMLERDPKNPDSLTEVFRMAHRIKGSSTAMGFDGVSRLTHELESLFDQVRSGVRTLEESKMNLIFRCVDALRDFHVALRAGTDAPVDLEEYTARVIVLLESDDDSEIDTPTDLPKARDAASIAEMERAEELASTAPVDGPEVVDVDASEADPGEPVCFDLGIRFTDGLPFAGLKAELIVQRLTAVAEVLRCDPSQTGLSDLDELQRLELSVVTSRSEGDLRLAAMAEGVADVTIEKAETNAEPAELPLADADDSSDASEPSGEPMVEAPGAEAYEAPPAPEADDPFEATAPPTPTAQPNVEAPGAAEPSEPSEPEFDDPSEEPVSPTPTIDPRIETPAAASLDVPPVAAPKNAPLAKASNGQGPKPAGPAKPSKDLAPDRPARRSTRPKAPGAPGRQPIPKVAETLRVEIDRLDHLMNLAGELVINKARFVQIAGGMQEVFRGKSAYFVSRGISDRLESVSAVLTNARDRDQPMEALDSLAGHFNRLQDEFRAVHDELERIEQGRQHFNSMAESIHQLTRISDGIQKSVMDARMVPVEPLFVRFKRVIRDMARELGKEVTLSIAGEKTELDKRMIDELGDPLIHMVRNSVDHAIEMPDAREAAGKPRCGVVELEAIQRGNSVVITVSDDGSGIDPEKIRAKAVQKGWLSESEAQQMPDKQILQYIWHPGFSTAAQVTDISGRGMGMDIVKSKIEELNGAVDVSSEIGTGTVFTIRLPLTLAIMPSLLARIHDEVYAIQLDAVQEIVSIESREIHSVHGQRTIKARGKIISLIRLDDVFAWAGGAHPSAGRGANSSGNGADDDLTVVIVQSAEAQIGLVVDHLIGEEEIVIKSLSENFMHVAGLAGASLLGDGRVSLILDVGAVIGLLAGKHGRLTA